MTEELDGLYQMLTTLDLYLKSYEIYLPKWVYILIIGIIIIAAIVCCLEVIIRNLWKVIQFFNSYFYNLETKDFIEVRKSFVGHLEHEVEKLNRESDWDDSLHYTELEAEVEVKQYIGLDLFQSKNPKVWLNNLIYVIKNIKAIKSLEKIEKNLTEAITKSKSQAFIIIGDPGSGKTVSLRHVFLEMARKAKNSKNKDAIVPIYLNLKQLNIEPDDISEDKIHSWIIEQLTNNKDRTVTEFVVKNFESMLTKGHFFFLFDSFDEILSVMDAQDENGIISKYSEAIDGFLHAGSKRRGLVSSRPYRSPRRFNAQKLTILPLSNERIEKALKKYLRQESSWGQKSSLSKQIWDGLLKREDLLHVVRNPFYLALLTQYCKINKRLPDRHFDLFEQFVQNRLSVDKYRLSSIGFTSDELIRHAEILAFSMTKTPNIGLEADINQIRIITSEYDKTAGWDSSKIEALLSALTYSKFGRKSNEEVGKPESFSFVHRRFHEYFCARYLKRETRSAPFEQFNLDNRWREVLVLLCEVLPINLLEPILELSLKSLKDENSLNSGSLEHKKALETILFLKDAFKSRINDVKYDLQLECSNFILKQFEDNNFLYQKRSLEALILADKDSAPIIIESAFKNNSKYLNETAFRSCRILERIPENILVTIRKNLFTNFLKMEINKDKNYSVLFSSSPTLKPLNRFLNTLLISTYIQILLIVGISFSLILIDPSNFKFIVYCIFVFLGIYLDLQISSKKDFFNVEPFTIISKSKTTLFSATMLYFSIIFPIHNRFFLMWILPLSIPYLLNAIYLIPRRELISQIVNLIQYSVLLIVSSIFIVYITDYLLNYFNLMRIVSPLIHYLTYLFGGVGIIIFACAIFGMIFVIISFITHNIKDQIVLYKLSLEMKKMKKSEISTYEALDRLNLFRTETAMARYIQLLINSLPVDGKNIKYIIERANEYEGDVKDMLYTLAETWDNSINKYDNC